MVRKRLYAKQTASVEYEQIDLFSLLEEEQRQVDRTAEQVRGYEITVGHAAVQRLRARGADDLEKIGISFSDDYTAGGKIVFDEEKFKTAMDSDPEKVSDLFTGTHGIVNTIDSTLSTYATRYASRNGNSYGVLIEEAGSEKLSLTLTNNSIYKELKDMQETITNLQSQLSTEQDRYISQFTQMERLINQMNSQSSYLSQLGG